MLARWFEILSQFHFRIEHRPGSEHVVPDALSRRPTETADQECQTEARSEDRCFRVSARDWSTSYIRSEQDKDDCISEVTRFLSAGVKPKKRDLPAACHRFLSQWSRLRLLDGVLFRVYRRKPFDSDQLQIVLPESLVQGVLLSFHAGPTGGHFAADKLFAQVRLRFWWATMSGDVEQFCRSCPQCGERNKPVPAPRASLGQLPVTAPMDVVALDILSGLPVTSQGHKHLLVIIDHFSRYVECIPLKTQEATEVAQSFVREFVSRYGVPRRIHSDLGGCFTSEVMKLTCQLLGMEHSRTTAFHPMGNSICERVNRSVLAMLSKYLEGHQHAEWDVHLPLLLLGLRSQIHRSLGVSPYCVLFGREPRLPADAELSGPSQTPCRTRTIAEYLEQLQASLRALHEVALENSNKGHSKNKSLYERRVNEFTYLPGDKIYLHRGVVPKGQYYKFLRPWKRGVVVDPVGPLNYRIRLEGSNSTLIVHHNRLKPRAESDIGGDSLPTTGPASAVSASATEVRQPEGRLPGETDAARREAGRGEWDDLSSRGSQWNDRPGPSAGSSVDVGDSRPPIHVLNSFALSFTPQLPSEPTVGLRRSTSVRVRPDRFVPG